MPYVPQGVKGTDDDDDDDDDEWGKMHKISTYKNFPELLMLCISNYGYIYIYIYI
jgi:hypothetical protein